MADIAPTLDEFTGLSIAGLDSYDVAVLNLCAARGLPGTESLDIAALLEKLDDWAQQVKFEICRHLYRFEIQSFQPPTEFSYGSSLARFFCWYMLQVLQEDCGVRYHPDRKFKPDFCQPEDLFIHGIVDDNGKGGTCASMPVVYVAVGRRLGLPVYLVQSRGHLFFRWDDPRGTTISWSNPNLKLWIPPDRFNVEGSGEGIAYYDDAHYIQWPELWTEIDFRHGRYLRSMTATETLADFLVQRSECFHERHNWNECLKSLYFARQLAPDDQRYDWLHAKRTKEWQAHQKSITRMLEMEQETRQRRREKQPGCQGHPLNCGCHLCQRSQEIVASRTVPPHGQSCECFHCRQAREEATKPQGMPGHTPFCQCAGCMQRRMQPQRPQVATFGQPAGRISEPHIPKPLSLPQPQRFGLPER
ncbi:MAG: transglutaminase family protein [Planctomycetaceae bacterium]